GFSRRGSVDRPSVPPPPKLWTWIVPSHAFERGDPSSLILCHSEKNGEQAVPWLGQPDPSALKPKSGVYRSQTERFLAGSARQRCQRAAFRAGTGSRPNGFGRPAQELSRPLAWTQGRNPGSNEPALAEGRSQGSQARGRSARKPTESRGGTEG